MTSKRKHTLTEAAGMFDTSTSRFSKFLLNHSDAAIHHPDSLSKKQAKQFYKFSKMFANTTVPWKVAILIDSTLQGRSSRHPANAKKIQSWQRVRDRASMDEHCIGLGRLNPVFSLITFRNRHCYFTTSFRKLMSIQNLQLSV